MKKKKAHYVDNKKLLAVIIQYKQDLKEARDAGKEDPRIPEYAGDALLKIARGIASRPNYINYTFKEEMISDAVENCILYFDRFNPEKSSNPFAYFTTFINYAFWRRIAREERMRYTTYKYFETVMSNTNVGQQVQNSEEVNTVVPYDNILDAISKFEEKEKVRKQKERDRKAAKKAT